MPSRTKQPEWVEGFRKALKQTCPKGWLVVPNRGGNMRLQVYENGKRIGGITLPYGWEEKSWADALLRIRAIAKAYSEGKGKIDIETAFKISHAVSSETGNDWPVAIKAYRKFKTRVSDATWKKKYQPVLNNVIALITKSRPPKNGPALCEKALSQWDKGTSQRRHMRLALYGLLNFCVQRQDFQSTQLPPSMTDNEVVSIKKRVGYPMTDAQILRLIDSLPDDEVGNKWRFAFQLMAVYGLRPEDLRYLGTRNGGKELWSNYQKSKGGKKGQKTDPRQLFPLLVHDVDGPVDWKLVQRVHIKEALPPLGTEEGKAGEAIGTYLRRKKERNVWNQLRKEAEAEFQQLTPYSFRHRYAYYGHNRPKGDGTYRAPKQVADAMGHSLDTHLLSYARFMTRDLGDAFDKVTA